MLKGIWYCT